MKRLLYRFRAWCHLVDGEFYAKIAIWHLIRRQKLLANLAKMEEPSMQIDEPSRINWQRFIDWVKR